MSADLHHLFSEDGPLAGAVPGFRARAQQQEMAQAIGETLDARGVLVAEAGTGTGKTFAYLVPALLSGGKVIVSTGTKTLQDQLFLKDLPTVRKALRVPVTVALLKGRANYICLHHLERAEASGQFASRDDVRYLRAIRSHVGLGGEGDRSRVQGVPEGAGVWAQVTSTRDNCLGAECAHFDGCYVMEARRAAIQADVVVVNHHLFFADLWLRDVGVGELLPACNTVIFDEAHQLPETASLFFGESVSTAQAIELARDTRAEALSAARDFAALPEAASRLEKAARDLRLACGADPGRLSQAAARARDGFEPALDALAQQLAAFDRVLESQAERSEGLANCLERSRDLGARLARWRAAEETDRVRWVEIFAHAASLNSTPLSVADLFGRQITSSARGWVFTSATLSVQGDFGHYCREMGLGEARTASWGSPFDYERQALLCIPEGLPEPSDPGFTEAVVRVAAPALAASGGRAFLLFTSLRAMQRAHAMLRARMQELGLDYPLLLQGEGPKNEMLERFRRLGNGILLGSQSFWEGVDVRGEALSLVLIDKLPFAPPDDPVLAARLEHIRRQGGNPFNDYQVPQAVLTLKQGAGRLIRDETDRGVLMICDRRLLSKPYGRRMLASLPPMPLTRRIEDVETFFAVQGTSAAAPG